MPYIALRNSIHNTETTVKVEPDELNQLRLSNKQARECRARLCPNGDCNCSGPIGANEALHYGMNQDKWLPVRFAFDTTTGRGWFVLVGNENN